MKKSIFTFILFALFGTAAVAQTANTTVKFAICGTAGSTIQRTDLAKCDYLVPVNKNMNVKSFTLSIMTAGVYVDYNCIGNKLSAAAIEALKKTTGTTKIMIGKIVGSDDTKYADFQMEIK